MTISNFLLSTNDQMLTELATKMKSDNIHLNSTTIDDENQIMEEHLHELYRFLAERKLKIPAQFDFDVSHIDWKTLNQLYKLIDLYLNAELRSSDQNATVIYVNKFRHFTHLFFADEKLDLESKYREKASVVYVGHRTNRVKNKGKGRASSYAIYKFILAQEKKAIDELVLYSKVNIDGNSGSITNIYRENNSIEVAFKDKKVTFDENQNYSIEIEFNKRMYYAHLRSIWLFENKGRGKFAVFPDNNDLIPYLNYVKMFYNFERDIQRTGGNGFDKEQNRAIFSIANGMHRTIPFILWGPPGTGKTVTIVECIRQLIEKDSKNRILVCTPSNTAADLIARRIYESGTVLEPSQMRRYYSLGKHINDRDKKLDKIIKIENTELFGLSDGRFAIDEYNEIKKTNIRLIFSTLGCSTYLEDKIAEENFFSHIFIDEASQSFEPETLIPITRFATEKTRIILSGDHQQLGAVMKAHFLKQYKRCTTSLMERLMTMDNSVYKDGRTYCQLTDSYRCHPHIIKFSSDNFYDGKLRAVKERERSAFCQWLYLPKKNFPVILHIVSTGFEMRQGEGRSFYNEGEVDVVVEYIRLIQETMPDVEDKEIGVISPYKFQAQKIRASLNNTNITVDSVECYQGSERRVIIISLARSEQPGFLTEYKRINTSFTRAKELLIVVASLSFVKNLYTYRTNHWNNFINYCIDNGAITIDKFVSEDGGELSAEEIIKFRHLLMDTLYSPPTKITTPREERKKLPYGKTKESEADFQRKIVLIPKSDSITFATPSQNHTSSSSLYPSTRNTEEEESTSQATTNKYAQDHQNEMRTISTETTKAMLKEIRNAEGGSISSDSDADGMAFWSNHFAECPTVQEEKKMNDNKKNTSHYTPGVFAQMDSSNIYPINALMVYDNNEVEDENDPELDELLEKISAEESLLEEQITRKTANNLTAPPQAVQSVSDLSNASTYILDGGIKFDGTPTTSEHLQFNKQSKDCLII